MFFRGKLPLHINKFSEDNLDKVVTQAAIWHEMQWGYLHHIKEDYFKERQDNFYIVKFNELPIGMFRLTDQLSIDNKMKIKHLSFVFVESTFQRMGVGNQIIKKAKEIAEKDNASLISLHTLNPTLNKFYEKQGAVPVCDGNIGINPTTLLRINI